MAMAGGSSETRGEMATVGRNRYEILPKPIKVIILCLVTAGLFLFILYTFSWSIRGWVLESTRYYYLLYVCFATCVFMVTPARAKDRNRVPWYDLVLATLVFGIFAYFVANAYSITLMGWVPPQTTHDLVLASVVAVLALEASRRITGWPLVSLCLLFGIYSLTASHMPGILYGFSFPFPTVIGTYAYGGLGLLGMPAQVTGEILIAFLIFAGVLMSSGAGTFFLNISLALLGRFRGGPAKVAVVSSGLFGSLSGTVVPNIITTGSITIPTMKRIGYPPHYAGAIEAVASSGGSIMPPVMGIIIFIMVVLTEIPYSVIMIAAVIPALLYYYGLLVQVDAFAARTGLKGLSREEVPSVWKTLKQGWPYIFVLAFLIFGLIYMRWDVKAPIYAAGLLVVFSFQRRETWMTPTRIIKTIAAIGNLVIYMIAILMPIGLIMVGLQVTGSLTSFTAQIMILGGVNVTYVLLVTVVICYVFGMVGMVMIPYVVLAATAIPALVGATGMNILALHLFVIYYLLMWTITPPIAVAAFVASGIAGSSPYKTGFTAMRLAIVLYFIPFFFVFNPALILEGPITETLYLFALCLVGIGILAAGLEGYLLKVGRLDLWARLLLIVGGFLIAFPGWMTTIIGAIIAAVVIPSVLIRKRVALARSSFPSARPEID
jgi:TRAP transporter 4TM/12TM fusion protein